MMKLSMDRSTAIMVVVFFVAWTLGLLSGIYVHGKWLKESPEARNPAQDSPP